MKNFLAVLLLFSACATQPLGQSMTAKMERLWGEIGYSGYTPPSVSAISRTEMQAMRGPFVVATYQCNGRAIYINADQSVDDDWLSGIIVHELVHHKQCLDGKLSSGVDMCRIEVEAYTAQIAWLRKLAQERGFLLGTNVNNHAAHVERYMLKHFSKCL